MSLPDSRHKVKPKINSHYIQTTRILDDLQRSE